MKIKKGFIFLLISVLIGLYFINSAFNFFGIAESSWVDKILSFVGGVLIIMGGVSFLVSKKRKKQAS